MSVMALTSVSANSITWDEVLPAMFGDPRFRRSKTSGRRWFVEIDGCRVGIVVSLRTADRDNHALNKEDFDKLLELRRAGSFDVAFVVLAALGENFASEYVGHRDAEEFFEELKVVRFRTGQFGDYWLMRGDFSLVDAELVVPEGW